jgi:Secretion system C-terminal sorting domain
MKPFLFVLLVMCGVFNLQAQRLQWQPVNGQEITLLPTTNTVRTMIGVSDKILVTLTNNGVFRSSDAGMTWQASNQGLSTTDTRTITTFGNLIVCGVAGTSTIQGLFVSADTGKIWKRLSSSSFGTTAFLRGIQSSLFSTAGGQAFVSLDSGKTFQAVNADSAGNAMGLFFENRSMGLFFEDNYLFTTISGKKGEKYFYQSNDVGKSWSRLGILSGEFTNLHKIDSVLFILTRDIEPIPNYFFRFTIQNQQVTKLYPMDFDGLGRYIIAIHKVGRCLLYADNDNGLYSSNDFGETWQSDKQGLPSAFTINQFVTIGNFVYALGSVPRKGGIIYRASLTPLTSVRENNIKPALKQPCFLESVFPNPANDASTLRWQVPSNMEVSLTVYDMLRRPVLKPLVPTLTPAGTHETMLNLQHLPSGNYMVLLRSRDHLCTKIITVIH